MTGQRIRTRKSADVLTTRDVDIMVDLYLTRSMEHDQIQKLHFTSPSRTRARLAELVKLKSYLERYKYHGHSSNAQPTCYSLTNQGYLYVESALFGSRKPFKKPRVAQVAERNLPHHLETVDLYVELRDDLNATLGEFPNWSWISEDRAYEEWSYGSTDTAHNPDAVIEFDDGTRFLIERQTERSRVGGEALRTRLHARQTYVSMKETNNTYPIHKTVLVYCCDTESQADLINIVARDMDMPMTVFATDIPTAAAYILEVANGERLMQDTTMDDPIF